MTGETSVGLMAACTEGKIDSVSSTELQVFGDFCLRAAFADSAKKSRIYVQVMPKKIGGSRTGETSVGLMAACTEGKIDFVSSTE